MRKINVPLKAKILEVYERQCDFAPAAGIREDDLSKIINGRRPPRESEKEKICRTLGVTAEELFGA